MLTYTHRFFYLLGPAFEVENEMGITDMVPADLEPERYYQLAERFVRNLTNLPL